MSLLSQLSYLLCEVVALDPVWSSLLHLCIWLDILGPMGNNDSTPAGSCNGCCSGVHEGQCTGLALYNPTMHTPV
jgi:hypothetical protein